MFFGAPQSRDRLYIVFWRKDMPAPDLTFTPQALCWHCRELVAAVQSWKNLAKQYGKYGRNGQYVYRCPRCARETIPMFLPTLVALDWSLPTTRIVLGFPSPPRWPPRAQRIVPPCTYGTLGLLLATDRLACVALQALAPDARVIQRQIMAVIQHAQLGGDSEQVMERLNALSSLMVALRHAYGGYFHAPMHAARQESRWEHVLTHQRVVHVARRE